MLNLHESPIDSTLVFSTPFDDSVLIDEKLSKSRRAAENWRPSSIHERFQLLERIYAAIENNRSQINQMVHQETGKPYEVADMETSAALELLQVVCGSRWGSQGHLLSSSVNGRKIYLERVPYGVTVLITAFNTPMPNFAWKVFPSLMAGNSVLLKPSPYTFQTAKLFERILWESGVPQDLFQVVYADNIGTLRLCRGDIDLFSFTGSTEVGTKLSKELSRPVKTILELGGVNAFIVERDADIESAVSSAISSAFSNSGQRCAAGSRLLVHKDIAAPFVEMISVELAKKSYGTSTSTDFGSMISRIAVERFENYLSQCKIIGATVIRLGKAESPSASSAQPAIVLNLKSESNEANCELFSPVMRIFEFENSESAVQIANGTKFGLTSAVWTQDLNRARWYFDRLSVGLVNINGPTHGAEPIIPFGGTKYSGNGSKDAGLTAVDEYSDHKVLTYFYR
jgi:acyl-CoA reductase-like NAD-dependent aldehyde dehydrogenase